MIRNAGQPGFVRGALIALLLSVLASVLYGAGALFPPFASVRLISCVVAFFYLLYLLRASEPRTGRVVLMAGWLVASFAAWLWNPGIIGFIALQALMIWLARSLFFHRSFLPAVLDLALSASAFAAGLWAGLHTGSLFMASWCFWLLQAAFVFIPRVGDKARRAGAADPATELFDRAYHRAENAFERLGRERP